MKVLLTGAGGYTGEGVAESLMTEHWVRGFDVKSREGLNDFVVADIADLDACREALDGIEAVVFCHMAPRGTAYKTPPMAMDINAKGTANMYHAMLERDIQRAVLVSSVGVLLDDNTGTTALPGHGPYRVSGRGLYLITKVFQEMIARHYFESHGIITSVLRPAWIIYDERLVTKYGEKVNYYNPKAIDPRDIGFAAVKCLALGDPTLEAFDLAQDDSKLYLKAAYDRLGWEHKYTFDTVDWDPKHFPDKPSRLKKA